MFIEVKTYKFTCGKCGKEEFVRDVAHYQPPEGWKMIDVVGMVNRPLTLASYLQREDECCAACVKEHEIRMRNKAFW